VPYLGRFAADDIAGVGQPGDRAQRQIISASVRDRLNAYRTQAQAGPVTDKALELH